MDILLILGLIVLLLALVFAFHQRTRVRMLSVKLEEQNEALQWTKCTLLASEYRFKSAMEAIPQMICISNNEGELEYMNELCASYLDNPKSTKEGVAAFWDLVHPDDRDRVRSAAVQGELTEKAYEIELRLRRPDQTYHWLSSRVSPLLDEKGKILRWFLTGADIQAKTVALNQAFTTEQKLRTLIDSLPIFIWSVDKDGVCDLIEGRVLQKIGLKPGQLIGLRYKDWFGATDAAITNYQRALAGEEFSVIREEAGTRLELHYSTLYDSNKKPIGVVGIGVDITDLHQAKVERAEFLVRENAAMEASRLKSDFLANMSHEIRTPLNGVIGMSRLLRETPLTAAQTPMVQSIEVCSESLLRIVNDVLDISKIEAGKLLLEKRSFDLHACLEHVHTIVGIKAFEKGLELQMKIDASVPQYAVGDMHRLHQILVNVLSNAVKFTEKGSVTLESWAVPMGEQTDRLHAVVSDSGIGMTDNEMQFVFQHFSQADASTTRRFGGTGLGLSIAKNLCEAMGGSISVVSKKDVGTQFSFALNIERSLGETVSPPQWDDAEYDIMTTEGKELSIIIAEDNEINSYILQNYLKILGLECEIVRDGEQLIERLKAKSFDIVFMDIHMPRLDGIMATKLIREDIDLKVQPYIIAVTASALLEDKKACESSGMNDFLSKPVTVKALLNCLTRRLQEIEHKSHPKAFNAIGPNIFDEFDGDDTIFGELAGLFEKQKVELSSGIEEAIAQEDFESLMRLSHTLRGSLHSFSSTLATPWAEALEAAARSHNIEVAKNSYAHLSPEMDQLSELMKRRLTVSDNATN
ncbi:MAG: response regulator [Oligoflexus sp.]|nr:response regulator [Oligoflexus sp.]